MAANAWSNVGQTTVPVIYGSSRITVLCVAKRKTSASEGLFWHHMRETNDQCPQSVLVPAKNN